ncbi:hypothetical protein WJX73_005121 [Symbiochloris irregularis]|uniref:Uncharacterized protein n=1 Tax=Symbiochloris irregularis TaxID=706552 RepID=A0AAW1NUX8_9CHLO
MRQLVFEAPVSTPVSTWEAAAERCLPEAQLLARPLTSEIIQRALQDYSTARGNLTSGAVASPLPSNFQQAAQASMQQGHMSHSSKATTCKSTKPSLCFVSAALKMMGWTI